MSTEYGKIEYDVHLSEDLTLYGMVTGNVTVNTGAVFVLHGMCSKNLILAEGAKAFLHGTVAGNVINLGGELEIYGTVVGYVRTENGDTFIDENAIVIAGTT